MMKKFKANQAVDQVSHAEGLHPVVQARYKEKLRAVGNIDPYSLDEREWSNDQAELPPLDYEDIVDYLLVRKSAYTKDDLKAVKSLRHAPSQLTSGWVREVVTFRPQQAAADTQNVIISAKVYHFERLSDKPLQPWVIVDSSGGILSAHCCCSAGLGGTCSHVASLLFTVDTMVRIRDSTTVTQVPAYWKQPPSEKIGYAPARKINFASAQQKMKQRNDCLTGLSQARKATTVRDIPKQSDDEIAAFFESISYAKSGVKPRILSVVKGYEKDYQEGVTEKEDFRVTGNTCGEPLSPVKKRAKLEESHTAENASLFCFCRGTEHGSMVCCDNENCKYEWFHYECVGIKRAPKGQWFCPQCRELPQFKHRKALPQKRSKP